MSSQTSLRAAQLTPPGRGAIATVQVTGPGAVAAVAKLFLPASGKPLSVGAHIYYGRWRHDAGEEVVVTAQAADLVEIHCHGGQAAPAAILKSLEHLGCEVVAWEDVLTRCLIIAEAQLALSQCTTQRAALHLLDQYNGALAAAVRDVQALLSAGETTTASKQIDELLSSAPLGLHLASPWRVVIAGRPNVGKSSLINALLGYERAIVFNEPGTTRDVVSAQTAFDGWPVELSDTAGLRHSTDLLETAGVAFAIRRLAAADLIVLVFDISEDWTRADDELMQQYPRALVVHNKADLPHRLAGRPDGLLLSATTGAGLAELQCRVVDRLIRCAPTKGQPLLFTERQHNLLQQAADALRDRHLEDAMLALQRVDASPAAEVR